MREIKFRAWEKLSMTMCHPLTMLQIMAYPDKVTKAAYDDLVLMQYTGLKDKNGVEIYEGDVIRLKNGERHEVKYGSCQCTADDNYEGGLAFGFYAGEEILGNSLVWRDRATDSASIEVIGNTYENPDLIEVEK